MARIRAAWLWYGVLVAAALAGSGCTQLGGLAYLFSGPPVIPPVLHKLASEDKKKEVKVMILAYTSLETRPELIGADRELSAILAKHLQAAFKRNQEKVTLISPQKIEQYKQQHPDWHEAINLDQIGRHFKADYVIYLEINQLGLYQKGSQQLYQGNLKTSISLINVSKQDELDNDHAEFSYDYPNGTNAIPTDDMSVEAFRFKFYNYAAEQLSWYFTGHTREDEYHQD